jgi:hypothetical protein
MSGSRGGPTSMFWRARSRMEEAQTWRFTRADAS